MNRRYRRQMMLRSRAHRRGEPIGCQCHRRTITTRLSRDVTVTICEPLWQLLPAERPVRTLPDIATFNSGMQSVQDALAKLGPTADTASGYLKELREVYDAGTE